MPCKKTRTLEESKHFPDRVEIPLSRGKWATISPEKWDMVKEYSWYASKNYNTYYALTGISYEGKRTTLKLHRLVSGAGEGQLVDHIDGDGLNNLDENLRVCSAEGNSRNRTVPNTNTSGYKGVYWDADRKRWRAQLHIGGTLVRLGRFKDLEAVLFLYGICR